MISGPGAIPCTIMAPIISAISAFGGIPKLNIGMKLACAAALFADSGAATPSIAPLPKRSGVLETFFSRLYAEKAAMVGPPPGKIPNTVPMAVPRTMAPNELLRSARLGHSPVTAFGFRSPACASSRLTMISANPNSPIESGTKSDAVE